MEPIIGGVDHVFVPVLDPQAVFHLLTRELGLPEAWPFQTYGAFASGGVGLGNANLEIVAHNPASPWFRAQAPARVQGVVFAPSRPVDAAYAEAVRMRNIPCLPPAPHEGELLGHRGVVWTNLLFLDFISPVAGAMVCEYHVPEAVDPAARQARLDGAQGGALGVLALAELVIASPDRAAAEARWRRLLDPVEPVGGVWILPLGPALRLVPGPADQVEGLVLRVRDPAAAARALAPFAPLLAGLEIDFVGA